MKPHNHLVDIRKEIDFYNKNMFTNCMHPQRDVLPWSLSLIKEQLIAPTKYFPNI